VRVTHVYRRENGEWKIVHRHGDEVPGLGQPAKAIQTVSSSALGQRPA